MTTKSPKSAVTWLDRLRWFLSGLIGIVLHFLGVSFSYVNPKVELRKGRICLGLFASARVKKHEVVVGWSGHVVHYTDMDRLMPVEDRQYILQIAEDLFQVPMWRKFNERADYVNHSCDPNCGFLDSSVILVAMRDIEPGEELTFDYAMTGTISGMGDEFDCTCGATCCRGKFSGNDWAEPKLHARYGDYFTSYIRRRIAAMRMTTATA